MATTVDPADNQTNSPDASVPSGSPTPGGAGSWLARLRRWFPAALLYREWRLNKGRYVLAALLLVLITLGPVVVGLFPPLFTRQVVGELNGLAMSNLGNVQVLSSSIVSVLLGVLVMRTDTGAARSHYLLSGPVWRRDVVRVKAGLGVASIVAAYGVLWVALSVISYQYPSAETTPALAVMFGVTFGHALLCVALFLTGLAAACTSSNVFLAAIGALLAAAVPQFVANLINFFDSSPFTGLPLFVPPSHAVSVVTSVVRELSPLAQVHAMAVRDDAFTTPRGLVYTLWFMAWVIGFWKLGARLFDRAPVERMSDTFFYPVLWYVVLAGLSFIVANVFAHVFTGMRNGYVFVFWFVLLFGASWFVIRRLVRVAGRRMEERS